MENNMVSRMFSRVFCMFAISMLFVTKAAADDIVVMPEFPGGVEALKQYLKENIVCPTTVRKMDITGEVVVEFTVERAGQLSGVNIVKGVCSELDEEALRVVRNMPRWKPGTKNGVSTRVKMTLPINFKIYKSSTKYVDESQEVTTKKRFRRRR